MSKCVLHYPLISNICYTPAHSLVISCFRLRNLKKRNDPYKGFGVRHFFESWYFPNPKTWRGGQILRYAFFDFERTPNPHFTPKLPVRPSRLNALFPQKAPTKILSWNICRIPQILSQIRWGPKQFSIFVFFDIPGLRFFHPTYLKFV